MINCHTTNNVTYSADKKFKILPLIYPIFPIKWLDQENLTYMRPSAQVRCHILMLSYELHFINYSQQLKYLPLDLSMLIM